MRFTTEQFADILDTMQAMLAIDDDGMANGMCLLRMFGYLFSKHGYVTKSTRDRGRAVSLGVAACAIYSIFHANPSPTSECTICESVVGGPTTKAHPWFVTDETKNIRFTETGAYRLTLRVSYCASCAFHVKYFEVYNVTNSSG